MLKPRIASALAMPLAFAVAACGGGNAPSSGGGATPKSGDTTPTSAGGASTSGGTRPTGSIIVTSTAFADGAEIPEQFTCKGGGQAPPLRWTMPASVSRQALVVDDPDAPGGTFVHWVVFDMPGSTTGLPQGGALPAGAMQATNSGGGLGWTPPCPPSGTHHYRFTVYALTGPTGMANGVAAQDAITTIERLAVDRGQLVGLVTHR